MAKLKCPEGGTTVKIAGSDPIFTDPEFKRLLDPLLPAELGQLESNLVADKRAQDPIVVWKERRTVLDGHNRLAICEERGLPYKLVFLSFPETPDGRTKALEWVIEHQLGRRNVSAEAKAKMVQWRRDRVAQAHQAGESTRTIATKEKISERTVREDIKKTGAAIESPDKVMGSDGKEYRRSRAERVGGPNGVPFVPKGEREPGDDTEQIKEDKRQARSNPKVGRPEFDWAAFGREFANFTLNVDKLGKVWKKHQTPEATKLRQDLLNWRNAFKAWGKEISKKEPTPDVVDKVRNKGKKGK